MSPLDKFGRQYIEETQRNKRPINALASSIERYIEIRQNWLKRSGLGFGWRGSWSKGKLFMNKAKTKKNIEVMQEVLVLLHDDSLNYQTRTNRIKALQGRLSSGGQGRQLLEVFLETSVNDNCAYIPSSSALEESVYVAKNTIYRRRETLGRGAFGKAQRFVSDEGGRSVVVKHMHNPYSSPEDVQAEIAMFKEVYDLLGRPYFGDDTDTCMLKTPTPDDLEGKVLLPEVPGGSIETFARDNPELDEEELFYSVFNFLERMHKELSITHRDCHVGNIMVVDQFYNVFFIDYGMAFKNNDLTRRDQAKLKEFRDGAREDVAMCLCDLFFVRKTKGETEGLKLKDLIAQYKLDRWNGFIFDDFGDELDQLEPYLRKKVTYFNRLVGVKAQLK